MTTRSLSHTEITAALDCEAKHAFSHTGRLSDGQTLKPKSATPRMREGRAWGRAVATYQANVLTTDGLAKGHAALSVALIEDADEQREAGVYDPEAHTEMAGRLHAILDHYATTTEPLPIDRPEHELDVAIRSRTGRRASNRYRFLAFLDGVHTDDEGRVWLYEAKLRGQLTSFEQVALDRQTRRYAWAWREVSGVEPAGAIVDERLNELPKPARLVNGRGKDAGKVASHAKDQLTTPELYVAACEQTGEEICEETRDALAQRRWQQRHPVVFRPGELDEAGAELVSAAQLVRDLDSGARWPIRNPSRARCPGCAFAPICADPEPDLIDALYERTVPKRDRATVTA